MWHRWKAASGIRVFQKDLGTSRCRELVSKVAPSRFRFRSLFGSKRGRFITWKLLLVFTQEARHFFLARFLLEKRLPRHRNRLTIEIWGNFPRHLWKVRTPRTDRQPLRWIVRWSHERRYRIFRMLSGLLLVRWLKGNKKYRANSSHLFQKENNFVATKCWRLTHALEQQHTHDKNLMGNLITDLRL